MAMLAILPLMRGVGVALRDRPGTTEDAGVSSSGCLIENQTVTGVVSDIALETRSRPL